MVDIKEMEEVVIIGSGPAGWSSAIYTARAGLEPLVLEGAAPGGQLMLTTEVENYPGFSQGIQGPELITEMRKQAERFEARVITANAKSVKKATEGFEIKFDDKAIKTKTVIIATGASARWLNAKGEEKYKGKGISTCATCDGFFFKGKDVMVVGGGDSAMEEASYLAKICKNVKVVHRRDELRASNIMEERVRKLDNVEFVWNTEVKEYIGDDQGLTGVKVFNNETEEKSEIKVDGVFLAIGHVPNVSFIEKGLVEFQKGNFVKTDNTKTKTQGLFVCGDVQDPKYKQAITAAGNGCKAALEAKDYLEGLE